MMRIEEETTINRLTRSIGYIPLFLVISTFAVFFWGAFRGLDVTDESFYVLNFLHWRAMAFNMSFFGAYFELPFRLMGESIPAIRIFGFILLAGAALSFFVELARSDVLGATPNTSTSQGGAYLVTGVSAALTYYSWGSTLRVPSYNLLVLVCMLGATGLLLRLARLALTDVRKISWMPAFGYGFIVSVCAYTKATSGVMLVFLHLLLYFSITGRRGLRTISRFFPAVLLGVASNVLVIQLFCPSWLEQAIRAKDMLFIYAEHRNLGETLNSARWDFEREVVLHWRWYAVLSLSIPGVLILRVRENIFVASILAVGLCAAVALYLAISPALAIWAVALWELAILLWLLRWATDRNGDAPLISLGMVTFFTVCFGLPIALSFGTNNSIAEHSKMASVFPLGVSLLLLRRLSGSLSIRREAYWLALACLCLPALAFQIRPLTEITFTYRQPVPLSEQKTFTPIGGGSSGLYLGQTLHDDVMRFRSALDKAGFHMGMPILDMTGDGPGLVLFAGGQPVGAPWLAGGYPGSNSTGTVYFLSQLSPSTLEHAWIISSPDNPRRIVPWRELLRDREGGWYHSKVGSILFHKTYVWNRSLKSEETVEIWKPVSGAGP
jgi:hypothetical protein